MDSGDERTKPRPNCGAVKARATGGGQFGFSSLCRLPTSRPIFLKWYGEKINLKDSEKNSIRLFQITSTEKLFEVSAVFGTISWEIALFAYKNHQCKVADIILADRTRFKNKNNLIENHFKIDQRTQFDNGFLNRNCHFKLWSLVSSMLYSIKFRRSHWIIQILRAIDLYKLTGFAKHTRFRILHRLNLESICCNDIFDLQTRNEMLSCVQFLIRPQAKFFPFLNMAMENEWTSITQRL